MSAQKLTKWLLPSLKRIRAKRQPIDVKDHRIFGIEDLIEQEKPSNFSIEPVAIEHHELALRMLKDHYLKEHVFIRTHGLDLRDNAIDEYLYSLLKQGNTVFAKNEDGVPVGICVNIASSPDDPENLRHFAHHRQNPETKDFLKFLAKLQETPDLWKVFKVPTIFEIKMLAVCPEYRRRGLATMMAQSSKELAVAQGLEVVRMDCINPHDFKIAERLLFHCMGKVPLQALCAHRLAGCARVYAAARCRDRPDAEHRWGREDLLE